MEINDRKSDIIVGKVIACTALPRIKAVSVKIQLKNGKIIEAYYEFGHFCFPIGGLLGPELNLKTPRFGKPELNKVAVFQLEDDWMRNMRLDDMKTRQGRQAASDADIEFEKTDRQKITAICPFRDWRNIEKQIADRPIFRIYQTPDTVNEDYLFEGTMYELEAEGDEAMWSPLLTVKEFFRGDWVTINSDPREAYKAKKLRREMQSMEQHNRPNRRHENQHNDDTSGDHVVPEQTVTAA